MQYMTYNHVSGAFFSSEGFPNQSQMPNLSVLIDKLCLTSWDQWPTYIINASLCATICFACAIVLHPQGGRMAFPMFETMPHVTQMQHSLQNGPFCQCCHLHHLLLTTGCSSNIDKGELWEGRDLWSLMSHIVLQINNSHKSMHI